MLLLCCCWPPHRCAISLSTLDTAIVGLLWFRSVDLLFASFHHTDLIDVFVFIVLFGLFVCEVLATATLVLSYRRQLARYVTPRLVLLFGQLAVAVLAATLIALYFGGLSQSINDFIISSYEYWSGLDLSESERKTAYNDLSTYAVGMFVLLSVFAVYNIFELFVTCKYQKNVGRSVEFIPISQTDASYGNTSSPQVLLAGATIDDAKSSTAQRPPPYNPNYGPTPPYKI